jgi:4-amino-4-deoxy-L-arabinose transferase-like glycosyltransferase
MNARRWIVPASVILIAIVAVALRLYRLDAVPPGLQHDEAFHGHDAVTVLLGYHLIYFPSNAGNEPLYVYLTAGTIALLGKDIWGIRLAAVICGLATVGFTWLWIRRAYNTRTALFASALVAVTFWPLFMSRAGLRSAALPPLAAMTAWVFWGAMQDASSKTQDARRKSQVARFILAGVLLGLTLYTYPASRALPIAYLLFALAYALFILRSTLYELAAFFVTAGLVFLPLYLYLRQAPTADLRIQQLLEIGALSALKSGNAGPLLANLRNTLGMFTLRGDPIWRYNIAGRPVFDPIVGALFYLGLIVALWRVRQPRYLFALIWLPVGLSPSILSDSAPSFLRASASLPVTFLFPALGADWLIERFKWKWALTAAVVGVIALSGALSVRDYFITWPARPEVRAVYRSDLAGVAGWLDARADDEPAVIASTNPHDVDPFLFDFELRKARPIKWVDHTYGLIFPQGRALYVSPADSPLAPELRDLMGSPPAFSRDSFVVYETDAPRIAPQVVLTTSMRFGDHLDLIGYQSPMSVKRGEWVRIWTYWRVLSDTQGEQWPIAVFAHLLDAQGQLVAQRDLLAVPTAGWRTGDTWVQFQDIPVSPDTSPAVYSVEIGVYNRADMRRWQLPDDSDRLLLPPVEIK